jgi:hypothetical protein
MHKNIQIDTNNFFFLIVFFFVVCACGNDDGARAIHVYYKRRKKSTGEHAQTQMYVFIKNTALIEKGKKKQHLERWHGNVCRRKVSVFFLSLPFSNRSSLSMLASTTSMYIIISCFVRKGKKSEREREKKRIVLFLAIGEYVLFFLSLTRFFFSFENRTEKEKTQLIGGIYRFEKFAGHVRQGSSKERGKEREREKSK